MAETKNLSNESQGKGQLAEIIRRAGIHEADRQAIKSLLSNSQHAEFASVELEEYLDSEGVGGTSPLGILVAAAANEAAKKYGVDVWPDEPTRRRLALGALDAVVEEKKGVSREKISREFEEGKISLMEKVAEVVGEWADDKDANPWAKLAAQQEMNIQLARRTAGLEVDLEWKRVELGQTRRELEAARQEREPEIQVPVAERDLEVMFNSLPAKTRKALDGLAARVAKGIPKEQIPGFLEGDGVRNLISELIRGDDVVSKGDLVRIFQGVDEKTLLAAFNLGDLLKRGITVKVKEAEENQRREEKIENSLAYFRKHEISINTSASKRMEVGVADDLAERVDQARALGISGDLFTARGKLRMKDGGELGLWALFRGENSRVGVGMATIFENDSDLNDAIVGLAVAIPRNPLYHDSLVLLKREELGWKVIVKGDEREIGILEVKDGGTIVLESRPDTGIREGLEVTVHLAALLSRFVGRGVSPVRISLEASVIREETAAPGAEEGQKEGAVSVPEEVAPAGKEAAVEGRVTEPTAEAGAPVEVEAAQTPSSPAVPPPAGDQPEVPGGQKRGRSDVAL